VQVSGFELQFYKTKTPKIKRRKLYFGSQFQMFTAGEAAHRGRNTCFTSWQPGGKSNKEAVRDGFQISPSRMLLQ
jgi:hypothetical protein